MFFVDNYFTMIRYSSVTIEREAQTLFDNIDFRVEEGEFIYLIGKVGAGKSSLLKTIYAELPITDGNARVFDYNLKKIKRSQIPYLRRNLGIIFQDFRLLTDRSVNDNLDFVLKATGWKSKEQREERIREVLALVGMETKGWRMPNTLSGGEQQRVVIARALLNRPKVILADEPTGNLDPETGHNIVELLHEICKSQNTAVVMSTHNLRFIEEFPGRVFRVENQKLIEANSVAEEKTAKEEETVAEEKTVTEEENIAEGNTASEDCTVTEDCTVSEDCTVKDQNNSELQEETQSDPENDSDDNNKS